MNCYYNYDMAVETLYSSAGRALETIIRKSRSFSNFGYKTYTKLFNYCVTPIHEYVAAIWEEKKYPRCINIYNRALSFFLFVPRSTPLAVSWKGIWVGCRLNIHEFYVK